MQSGLLLCIGRFKARLNWRWLSKARDSYGFMSCVAQMLILCRYTQCMDFTGDFYAACSGLFVHDCSAPRSWLYLMFCVCVVFHCFLKALNGRCIM